MTFLGADTEALRGHATTTQTQARRVEVLVSDLMDAAAGVPWEGSDAEDFRRRCVGIRVRGVALASSLRTFGTSLTEQAEEQDSASEAGGRTLAGLPGDPLTDLLGGALGGLIGSVRGTGPAGVGAGSPFLGVSGTAAGLLTGLAGGGFDTTGLRSEMGTPIDPSVFEPDDSTSTTAGGSVKTGDTTRKGSVTVEDDGTRTYSYEVSEERELEVGSEAAGGSATLKTGDTTTVSENPDGTLTVTFDAEVTGSAEMHGQVRGVEGGVESEVSGKGSYSVTLPPGSSPDDAVGINPFDPDTIPPGASVKITGELSGSVGASLGYGDAATGKLALTGGEEMVTTVAKDADGTVAVDMGPGTTSGVDASLQIGPDQANVTFDGESYVKKSTIEHTEFSDTPEGRAAFDGYMFSGEQPEAGSPGVDDAYSDLVTSKVSKSALTATAGDGDGTETSAGAAAENAKVTSVERTYSDGSSVKEHRFNPHGEGMDENGPYGVAHSSSDGPTYYELRYPQDGSAPPNSYHEKYGDLPYTFGEDQTINVQLSEAEMQQIIENRGKGETPEEVLNAYAASGPQGAQQMAEDFSGVGSGQPAAAPGRITEPGAGSDPSQGGGGSTGGSGGSRGTRAVPSAS